MVPHPTKELNQETNMEKRNETLGLGLVHRAIAFGLAVATTTVVAASTVVIFTGSSAAISAGIGQAAIAPLRAVLGS
jgi:hypothetical protein